MIFVYVLGGNVWDVIFPRQTLIQCDSKIFVTIHTNPHESRSSPLIDNDREKKSPGREEWPSKINLHFDTLIGNLFVQNHWVNTWRSSFSLDCMLSGEVTSDWRRLFSLKGSVLLKNVVETFFTFQLAFKAEASTVGSAFWILYQ